MGDDLGAKSVTKARKLYVGTFGDFWQRRRRGRRRRNRAFYFLIFTQSIDFFYDSLSMASMTLKRVWKKLD